MTRVIRIVSGQPPAPEWKSSTGKAQCEYMIWEEGRSLQPAHWRRCLNPAQGDGPLCWSHIPENMARFVEQAKARHRHARARFQDRGKPVLVRSIQRVAVHWWFELAGGAQAFEEFS